MKALLTFGILSCVTILSAGQYDQGGYDSSYQGQSNSPSMKRSGNPQPYNANRAGSQDSRSTGYVSDDEIKKNVSDALKGGWFSGGYENVNIAVYNGVVTLNGSVDSADNRNKLMEKVKSIDGVRGVNNQVAVNAQPSSSNAGASSSSNYTDSQLQKSESKHPKDSAATSQDRQINAKIHDKVDGWFVTNETLVFRTNNGVVTVYGTVEKYDDIQDLLNKLRQIEGVNAVNNKLTAKNK
ncbi:MAG: BON domain-containing protein [Parachlamydia sp.]|nr:BON domain-containing protein [Parachlamydia sp.]